MKASTIAKRIGEGVYDDDIEYLNQALRTRNDFIRDQKRLDMRGSLSAGDTVEITGGIRPRYIVGTQGTVTHVGPKYVTIDVTRGETRRYPRKGLKIPLNCIEKVG